jgi:AcrR family transcriptional regulator
MSDPTGAPGSGGPLADDPSGPEWSPNQQAARARIARAAAALIMREGIGACTVRAVADEAGTTKSTVHYYVHDANELVDLGVESFLRLLATETRARMDDEPDAVAALRILVDAFMDREKRVVTLEDPTVWAAYTAHAWARGASEQLVVCFELFGGLFEHALARCGVEDAAERGWSIYMYLLGAAQRNVVLPVSAGEVERAVSALGGVALAPVRHRSRARA